MAFIYSLSCPDSGAVRYIGKAENPDDRFRIGHLNKSRLSKPTHKNHWIKSLLKEGKEPMMGIIDQVDDSDWAFWEMHYISLYKSWGFKLTNSTDGGEGTTGHKHTEESKRRMSKAKKDKPGLRTGVKHSAETISRMSKSLKGRPAPNKGEIRSTSLCIHCGKAVDFANMRRWHGENCNALTIKEPQNNAPDMPLAA